MHEVKVKVKEHASPVLECHNMPRSRWSKLVAGACMRAPYTRPEPRAGATRKARRLLASRKQEAQAFQPGEQ